MKTRMVLSLLVVLAFSCQKEIANKTTAASASVDAFSTQKPQEILIDESQYVPCFGKWVTLIGDLKYNIKSDTISDNIHYNEEWNEKLNGTDDSGTKYTGELHTHYEGWDYNYQSQDYTIPRAMAIAHLKLNKQGGGSITIRQDFVMVSSNGVTRVPHLTNIVECN